MFGWEFPPCNSGGLGVACQGLINALTKQSVKITFVLPKKTDYQKPPCKIIFADGILKIKSVDSPLSPYITSKSYRQSLWDNDGGRNIYGLNLFEEVERYGREAGKIALCEDFDIIHAHDWLSAPAGMKAKEISGKPLILHIHATEFDRTGGNKINQKVYEIEKEGMEKADMIIANSNFTKNKIVRHYGIKPEKIKVVYNATDIPTNEQTGMPESERIKKSGKKIVLFAGRITLQKGPDYFLLAAQKALKHNPDILFIIAGAGDMEAQIIEEAARLDIADKVLFAGFLRGDDLIKAYRTADLYVLPSVSEPFGITPLESLSQGTPVLISKQSGVSEVLSHALKVDFWNTNEMADKILAALKHKELHQSLKENGTREARKLTWSDSARQCIDIYSETIKNI